VIASKIAATGVTIGAMTNAKERKRSATEKMIVATTAGIAAMTVGTTDGIVGTTDGTVGTTDGTDEITDGTDEITDGTAAIIAGTTAGTIVAHRFARHTVPPGTAKIQKESASILLALPFLLVKSPASGEPRHFE
jgi:hypothetical protein